MSEEIFTEANIQYIRRSERLHQLEQRLFTKADILEDGYKALEIMPEHPNGKYNGINYNMSLKGLVTQIVSTSLNSQLTLDKEFEFYTRLDTEKKKLVRQFLDLAHRNMDLNNTEAALEALFFLTYGQLVQQDNKEVDKAFERARNITSN